MLDRPTGAFDGAAATRLAYAALAGVAGVAGSFAVAGSSRSFVVAPVDAFVVRNTPGPVVAWSIQTLGSAGHLLHLGLSLAGAVALLGLAALAGIETARLTGRAVVGVPAAGILGWLATAPLTGRPLLSAGAAVPLAAFAAVGTVPAADGPATRPSRRRLLGAVAGAAGYVGLATAIGTLGGPGGDRSAGETTAPGADGVAALERTASERELAIEGDVPGLVSEIGGFYNVDIAQFDPQLPADDWSLSVTGAVESDVTVDFEGLTARPTEHRFVTLRCVGEPLDGEKLDTAIWTGTPLRPLFEEATPASGCGCAMLRAADGYFVQFPLDALDDAFLAWGMNGRPLPRSHGNPVRVLVPGHWGETNVKWLEEIELLDEAAKGYWERRGWHGTGPVNTVAKLWSVAELEDGRTELAGHAYAGTRSVQRVEVSTDGGASWTDAALSEPLPGDDVWRQWRHVFDPDGRREVVVRAVDGEGNLQPRERSEAFPSGATGWVTRTVGG